eukprot:gnl/MRDRNA2_/MRDRNA2_80251_c0_seq2.p1 gnl/MRDRNA2_/MRDRNA2_80251_c0~~gnl/MRDRNA2_/MRDRNA2_80251_c0_seq2.p1  ORF type:complete len:255 (+),score=46.98 gnl/MRDRNA2_/MRDRNA2_80251_c0_seq2:95-859(+)
MSKLQIYAVPLSQCCRSVIWVCLYKRVPFELVITNPGSKSRGKAGNVGSRHPEFLAINPCGTVPAIKDSDGYVLWESNAILMYLGEKYGWTDLYPTDLRQRSKINQYLHWHNRYVREISHHLDIPNSAWNVDKFPESVLEQGRVLIKKAMEVLENAFLSNGKYIIGDTLSIADFVCHAELAQVAPKFGNLFDFSDYPKFVMWMNAMEQVPGFTETNMANSMVGNMMNGVPFEVIRRANKEGVAAVQKAVAVAKL